MSRQEECEQDMMESFHRILKAISTGRQLEHVVVAAAILTLAASIERGVLVWKGEV